MAAALEEDFSATGVHVAVRAEAGVDDALPVVLEVVGLVGALATAARVPTALPTIAQRAAVVIPAVRTWRRMSGVMGVRVMGQSSPCSWWSCFLWAARDSCSVASSPFSLLEESLRSDELSSLSDSPPP